MGNTEIDKMDPGEKEGPNNIKKGELKHKKK